MNTADKLVRGNNEPLCHDNGSCFARKDGHCTILDNTDFKGRQCPYKKECSEQVSIRRDAIICSKVVFFPDRTGTFPDVMRIKKIVLPYGVKAIEDYAFSGCENLEEIILPATLSKIGERAFSGCISLKKLRIPRGVTSIGADAFAGCRELTIIVPKGSFSAEYCERRPWLNYQVME